MVDYRPEKKSIRDYYKVFMGKGDEVGRDQRRRRYKRIRTQKETKRIKEQTQDLKKDIEIKIEPSNDIRSYQINSDKIQKLLNFGLQRNLKML